MRDLCSASQLRFRVAGDCKTQRGGERLRDACVYKYAVHDNSGSSPVDDKLKYVPLNFEKKGGEEERKKLKKRNFQLAENSWIKASVRRRDFLKIYICNKLFFLIARVFSEK